MKLTNKFQKIAASFSLLFFLNLFVFIQSAHTTRYTCHANVHCTKGSFGYFQCFGTGNSCKSGSENGGWVECNNQRIECRSF
ncbi:hypothetical protein DRQ07_06265 [candidate division KSB1 bacterium]|nr:MAG: hypothetical protein DRQ07_06265 [candidate division KSB1 bacterium]